MDSHPDDDLVRRSYRGLVLDEVAEYEWIIRRLDQWLEGDPTNAHAFNNRAVAFLELGEVERAREDFDRAVLLATHDFVPWANRGRLRVEAGDVAGGIDDLTQAITIEPFATDLIARGRAFLALGMANPALADFERATQLGGRVEDDLAEARAQITAAGTRSDSPLQK